MPLPLTVSCFSKIQLGFTFLVLAYPGSPGQRAVKRVCVCVCYCSMQCIRGTSHGPVFVRLSIHPSQVVVLLKRLTQTTPHNSPGTLVF